jgi:hypothetical protein
MRGPKLSKTRKANTPRARGSQRSTKPISKQQTDRDEADRALARETERYRNRVSLGHEGAHPPKEKTPYEEAQEDMQEAEKGAAEVREDPKSGKKSGPRRTTTIA